MFPPRASRKQRNPLVEGFFAFFFAYLMVFCFFYHTTRLWLCQLLSFSMSKPVTVHACVPSNGILYRLSYCPPGPGVCAGDGETLVPEPGVLPGPAWVFPDAPGVLCVPPALPPGPDWEFPEELPWDAPFCPGYACAPPEPEVLPDGCCWAAAPGWAWDEPPGWVAAVVGWAAAPGWACAAVVGCAALSCGFDWLLPPFWDCGFVSAACVPPVCCAFVSAGVCAAVVCWALLSTAPFWAAVLVLPSPVPSKW